MMRRTHTQKLDNEKAALFAQNFRELQARTDIPPLTWTDVFKVPDGNDPPSLEDQHAINTYLQRFMAFPKNDKDECICPGCRNSFGSSGDGLTSFLMQGAPGRTGLRWLIAHGEAACTTCGYPYRQYHYDIGAKDKPLIKELHLAMPYHPSGLALKPHPRVEDE